MVPVQARINGKKLLFKSRHALARHLMDLLVSAEQSLEAKTKNLQQIMEMMRFKAKAEYFGNIWSEKVYEKAYWETVLSLEHMGTLPGFCVTCSIEKGSSNFSPEHRRISTDWTIK